MGRLTDRQQAIVMLLVFILPPIITWTALGYPTDRVSLGILGSAILSGILVFLKELLGGAPQKKVNSLSKRRAKEDDPDLKERVIRLENDVQWIKKIVWRDHYLAISSLIGIILTILAVLLK